MLCSQREVFLCECHYESLVEFTPAKTQTFVCSQQVKGFPGREQLYLCFKCLVSCNSLSFLAWPIPIKSEMCQLRLSLTYFQLFTGCWHASRQVL